MIVEGQVHGGMAQGIAQALFEEAVYDDDGQPGHRHVRRLPGAGAADLPSFTTDRTETPATTNPLGVKGVGEAGTIASTPAVVNAVVDAVRQFGVDDVADAVHARSGCGGRSRTQGRRRRRWRRPRRQRHGRLRRRAAPRRTAGGERA